MMTSLMIMVTVLTFAGLAAITVGCNETLTRIFFEFQNRNEKKVSVVNTIKGLQVSFNCTELQYLQALKELSQLPSFVIENLARQQATLSVLSHSKYVEKYVIGWDHSASRFNINSKNIAINVDYCKSLSYELCYRFGSVCDRLGGIDSQSWSSYSDQAVAQELVAAGIAKELATDAVASWVAKSILSPASLTKGQLEIGRRYCRLL